MGQQWQPKSRAMQYSPLKPVRGGAREKRKRPSQKPRVLWSFNSELESHEKPLRYKRIPRHLMSSTLQTPRVRFTFLSIVSVIAALLAYQYRSYWTPFFDKEVIEQKTLGILKKLQPEDGENPFMALFVYSMGMTAWELFGLSTIPIETAAGVVFGVRQGFVASLFGKLLGASLCYGLGQHLVPETTLQRNKYFNRLLESSAATASVTQRKRKLQHPNHLDPLWSALLLKFSIFPELIKNMGSAALNISYPKFLLATLLHGGSFTLLWSYLGGSSNPPTKVIFAACVVIGFGLSPLNLVWWMRRISTTDNKAMKDTPTTNRALQHLLDSPWSLVGVWIVVLSLTVAIAATW